MNPILLAIIVSAAIAVGVWLVFRWGCEMSEQKHITIFDARFENGCIQVRVEAGAYIGRFILSDQFMAGVRAYYTEDLVKALKVFAAEPLSTEPGHDRTRLFSFEDLDEKIRLARAAIAKAEGRG